MNDVERRMDHFIIALRYMLNRRLDAYRSLQKQIGDYRKWKEDLSKMPKWYYRFPDGTRICYDVRHPPFRNPELIKLLKKDLVAHFEEKIRF